MIVYRSEPRQLVAIFLWEHLMTTFMRLITPFICLMLTSCATGTQAPSESAFHVMRHLHTITTIRDPHLTETGARHALLLADGWTGAKPSAIYVTDTLRARETAGPLAARLGLVPKIYEAQDYGALAAAVRAETGSVLIVGHSNTVPDIIAALGGEKPAPLTLEDFGDLWRISRTDGAVTRTRIGE